MTIGDHFIHRCTIERPGGTTLDAFNNAAATYSTVAASVPCRLVEKEEQVRTDERAESVVRTKYTLLLNAGIDVRERDRVLVDGRTFTIAAVMKRNARGPHHVSVRLEIVS